MNTENAWLTYSPEQKAAVEALAQDYMQFISLGKTERRCVKQAVSLAEGFGFKNINEYLENGKKLAVQDKIYCNFMDKAVALFQIGSDPLKNGLNILGAHIDSPRLDLKPSPLYEKDGIAFFDTHYYGGIKKYQWTCRPLALYGVVYLKDGTHMDIAIGDHEEDEVFCIPELLVHLSSEQQSKPANQAVAGEDLDLIAGSIPADSDDEKKGDAVKQNLLALLKDRYGIDEDDFVSAELEVVPQGRARTLGLDRSMILGYGQDDRICAYTSLLALLENSSEPIERTCAVLLVDKEEIGSVGATGMQSKRFENALGAIMKSLGQYDDLNLKLALQNSTMLSNDVCAGHDPVYASVSSPNGNMAKLGFGLGVSKYTGSRGKSGSNDARAEYISALRKVFNDAGVIWQPAELGRVDAGGGGTIAYIMAGYGMDVIDTGVALLNMHAPFEVSSKADLYEALKAYKAFLKNMKGIDVQLY